MKISIYARVFVLLSFCLISLTWSLSYAVEFNKLKSKLSADELAAISFFAASAANIDTQCGLPVNDGGLSSDLASMVAAQTASAAIENKSALQGSITLLLAKVKTTEFDCGESKSFRETIGKIVINSISNSREESKLSDKVLNKIASLIAKDENVTVNPSPLKQQSVEDTNDSLLPINKNVTLRINDILSIPKPDIPGVKDVTQDVLKSSFAGKQGKLIGAALHTLNDNLQRNESYFAILGSFKSKSGAMRHLNNLRNRQVSFEGVVYPPRTKGNFWTVVAASYANFDEAKAEVLEARRTHLAKDAYVWSAWRRNIKRNNTPFFPYGKSFKAQYWPDFLTKFSSDSSGSYFVSIAGALDQSAANTKRDALRVKYPNVPMIIFGPLQESQGWRVMIAAHTTREMIEEAVRLARRSGFHDALEVLSLPTSLSTLWVANDPMLEKESHELKQKINKCIDAGNITVGTMQNCLGGYLSREAFVACSDSIDDETKKLPSLASQTKCRIETIKTETQAKLDTVLVETEGELSLIPAEKMTDLLACKTRYPTNKDESAFLDCALPLKLSNNQVKAIECMKKPENDAAKCLLDLSPETNSEKVIATYDCIRKSKQDSVSVNSISACFGEPDKNLKEMSDTAECVKNSTTSNSLSKCWTKTGVESEYLKCVTVAGSDKNAVLSCIKNHDPKLKHVIISRECLLTAGKDLAKQANCMTQLTGEENIVSRATTCVNKEGNELAGCLSDIIGLGNDVKKATELASCIEKNSNNKHQQALCLSEFTGIKREDANTALCVASGKNPLDCLAAVNADVSRAMQVYNCTQSANDAFNMIESCSSALNIGDRKTVKTVACLARSEGDKGKMAMCAMNSVVKLDENTQKMVDCAASSQGYVEFGLCASGSKLNPEMRVALECVSSTGGEPYSTVACTGGRLAIREFQKCVSSGMKIGSDQCFGKNNTLRKYYEDMGRLYESAARTAYNDLTKGFGKNNDLVKAGKEAEKLVGDASKKLEVAVNDAGKALEKGVQDTGKALEKGVQNLSKEAEKGAQNAGKAVEKAGQWLGTRTGIHIF